MKKILSVISALALSASMMLMPASAVSSTDSVESGSCASMCFDSDASLNYINYFGDYELLGNTITFDSSTKAHKDGSLVFSQNFEGSYTGDQTQSGFSISSQAFGLENFAGSTISFYVYPIASGADKLCFFTNGDIYMTDQVKMTASPIWQQVTIEVADDIKNTEFGVLVESSNGFNDAVFYLDDLVVTRPDGTVVENIGDYKTSDIKSDSPAAKTFTVVLIVVIVAAVVLGGGYYVFKQKTKYR